MERGCGVLPESDPEAPEVVRPQEEKLKLEAVGERDPSQDSIQVRKTSLFDRFLQFTLH